MSICKNDGKSICQCKGKKCFWTTLGRNCNCKRTRAAPSRLIDHGVCNIKTTKNKCPKSGNQEYLEGESCSADCRSGKQFNCTCNCKARASNLVGSKISLFHYFIS